MPQFDKFPNPNDESPSFGDGLEDLRREQAEKRGEHPPPWKTVAFWLSLTASILAYLAASQALPIYINEWILLALAAFVHFGYGTVANYFLKNPSGFDAGVPNWKRTGFYASFAAVIASYALGSGHEEAARLGGQAAVFLGYFGYAVRPWIKRRGMMLGDSPDLIQRILSFLLFLAQPKPSKKTALPPVPEKVSKYYSDPPNYSC